MKPVLTAYHALPSTEMDWKAWIRSHQSALWLERDNPRGRTFQDRFVKGINR